MAINFAHLPRSVVTVDALNVTGPFEGWRHSIGHGGVNYLPLPDRIVVGAQKLKPRLARIFLQEYFHIYPDHGKFDWTRLDPYMESFHKTGAKVVASINLKPLVLYPTVDQTVWRPNNIEEWQNMLYQLVKRYSVERQIVTHWEHVNEPDIGEWGGCPFLIISADELYEFYRLNIDPILRAYPEAKVGGPCPASYEAALPFIDRCARDGLPLDFVSYHRYDDSSETHRRIIEFLSEKLDTFPGKRPELMINEWNKGFEPPFDAHGLDAISVEEMAMSPRRAAHVAKIILTMMETRLDWSFYYLLWDSCMFNVDWRTFYSEEGARGVMYQHWNNSPHRFGLFSESGRVRPQYFVYQILSRMGAERLAVKGAAQDISIAATGGENGRLSILLVNFDPHASRDQIVKVRFENLSPGLKRISAARIDEDCRWLEEDMELLPYEQRRVDVLSSFEYQFYSPADSVLWVTLEDYS